MKNKIDFLIFLMKIMIKILGRFFWFLCLFIINIYFFETDDEYHQITDLNDWLTSLSFNSLNYMI